MSQTFVPMTVMGACLALAVGLRWAVTSISLGRMSDNVPNMMHPVAGMHVGANEWNRPHQFYHFHRDLAISDAVHDGTENYLGPEIEEELDLLYLEVFMQKKLREMEEQKQQKNA